MFQDIDLEPLTLIPPATKDFITVLHVEGLLHQLYDCRHGNSYGHGLGWQYVPQDRLLKPRKKSFKQTFFESFNALIGFSAEKRLSQKLRTRDSTTTRNFRSLGTTSFTPSAAIGYFIS